MAGTQPSNVIDDDDALYNQIVAKRQDLLGMQKEIVLFAFCSLTGKVNCMDYYFNAHTKFWGLLVYPDIDESRRKAVDFVISQGDDLYVRFLFADGTIFCKKTDGGHTQAFQEVTMPNDRKNIDSLWVKSIKTSTTYFMTILEKYFDRFHFDQEIQGVDKVLESAGKSGCASYYDVSMRDGLDAMIKLLLAEGTKDQIERILEAFVPDGRFNNFMLGSLYDAILLNNSDIMVILQAWVDCERVESSYKDFCNAIMGPIREGKDISEIPRKPGVLDQQHMSTSGNGEAASIQNEMKNFNRTGIDLIWLLDT
ncbi:hypothetical protein IWQ62_000031 [Dispira parvispora]|uniref:Uncharacterized protein n=1 Tax=Dispira parvispora TaxID=1520584 RepID=A0A9W8E6I2_9FUNG|nr:hypothetical protein IWQ62_000031 [Dispira parvispora]